jgi:hypothetical protein
MVVILPTYFIFNYTRIAYLLSHKFIMQMSPVSCLTTCTVLEK